MKIYLASPFFNELEIQRVEEVQRILVEKGFEVFSPKEHQFDKEFEIGSSAWSLATFNNDKKFIDWAEIMVAVYDGNYSDSGTAWEIGYAYGTQKPIVIVHVGETSNLMIHEGSHASLTIDELKEYDFNKMPSKKYTGKMF
ncbi:MAG: nucleoside 2-deoxyribosyltransferase [Peptostreptococcaceae bacterium]